MNPERIDTAVMGAVCLLVGWALGTLVHEGGHIVAARSLGHPVSLGEISLGTGSVFVHGAMTDTQTALVAVAGSVVLIGVGVALTRLSGSPATRMIGVVFLCRAWVDVLPIRDLDGAFVAQGAGWTVAWLVVVVEVLVCGGVIYSELKGSDQF